MRYFRISDKNYLHVFTQKLANKHESDNLDFLHVCVICVNNYIIFENLNFNPDPRKKLSFSMHLPTMKIAGVEFAPVSGKTSICMYIKK